MSNAGAVAGQEVFHSHVHVLPRYASAPGMANLKVVVEEPVEVTAQRVNGAR
nr:HIT domain-containing protein [Tessaracoccus coleopterorum]